MERERQGSLPYLRAVPTHCLGGPAVPVVRACAWPRAAGRAAGGRPRAAPQHLRKAPRVDIAGSVERALLAAARGTYTYYTLPEESSSSRGTPGTGRPGSARSLCVALVPEVCVLCGLGSAYQHVTGGSDCGGRQVSRGSQHAECAARREDEVSMTPRRSRSVHIFEGDSLVQWVPCKVS